MAGDTVAVGDVAPDFQRPGVDRGEFAMYDLHRPIDYGDAVVLVFFPTDFLELPTTALVALGEAGWHTRGGLTVWGLSGDSIFAHHRYGEHHGIEVPLLSDFHAGVATHYGLAIDDWEGHGATPSWAWVVIDRDWVVRYVWSSPPTPRWERPPVDEIAAAVREHADVAVADLDLDAARV